MHFNIKGKSLNPVRTQIIIYVKNFMHNSSTALQLCKYRRTDVNMLPVKTGSYRKMSADKCIIWIIFVTVSEVSKTIATRDDSLDSAYRHIHSYDLLQ